MITVSYNGSATVCNLMSVVWEDPKRQWILVKMASYPSEEIRKGILGNPPVDIACPSPDEGEVQYNTCKNLYDITVEEYRILESIIKDNWPKDNEPLAEFIAKGYEKKVRL